VKVTSLQFLVYDAQNLKKEWQRKLNLIEALISEKQFYFENQFD